MLCANCKKPLTSSAPGGEYRYFCHRPDCRGTGSITSSDAHARFEGILAAVTPKASTIRLMKEILVRTSVKELGSINQDIADTRDKLDEIAQTRANIIKMYANGKISDEDKEEGINGLCDERFSLSEELNSLEQRQTVSEASIEYALNFMENIAKQWSDASLDVKQKMQELIFPKGFIYDIKNDNFIINEISPLYRCISPDMEADSAKNSVMVTSRRIELRLPG